MLLVHTDPVHREPQLRALGAFLDAHAARAILIRDTRDGLLVRGRVPAERIDGGTMPLERRFETSEVFVATVEAMKRRGSAGRGGPLERDLRLVGRLVDLERWTDISVLQVDDAWVVRYRLPATRLPGTVTLDRGRLVALEEEAIRARREAVAGLEPAGSR